MDQQSYPSSTEVGLVKLWFSSLRVPSYLNEPLDTARHLVTVALHVIVMVVISIASVANSSLLKLVGIWRLLTHSLTMPASVDEVCDRWCIRGKSVFKSPRRHRLIMLIVLISLFRTADVTLQERITQDHKLLTGWSQRQTWTTDVK